MPITGLSSRVTRNSSNVGRRGLELSSLTTGVQLWPPPRLLYLKRPAGGGVEAQTSEKVQQKSTFCDSWYIHIRSPTARFCLRQLCSRVTACFLSLIKSLHTPAAWQHRQLSALQKKPYPETKNPTEHKEDHLLTSFFFFFFFGIKCAACGAASVRQLRKTLSTVLTKLLLFALLKITVISSVKVGNALFFFDFFPSTSLFFFCIKTSKAGKARQRKASGKSSIAFPSVTLQNKMSVMKSRDAVYTWLQLFR